MLKHKKPCLTDSNGVNGFFSKVFYRPPIREVYLKSRYPRYFSLDAVFGFDIGVKVLKAKRNQTEEKMI
jgi:hypothetical protein